MLVLTTLFINVSNNLPKTSYMKMVDVWLLFNLILPFIVVLIHTKKDTLRNDSNNDHDDNNSSANKVLEKFLSSNYLKLLRSTLSRWPQYLSLRKRRPRRKERML